MANIAVCGKFHILNYIEYLSEQGNLDTLYMSHKARTAKCLNLPNYKVRNYPLKEYLVRAHAKILGNNFYDAAIIYYHYLWEKSVLQNYVDSKILHVVSQGAACNLIQKSKKIGSKVLVEVVNTHPKNRLEIMQKEALKWGVKSFRNELFLREKYILKEVEMSDCLLAPSSHVANTYVSYGYTKPIYILPYAANVERFNLEAFENYDKKLGKKLKIISVGQVGLRKGQLYLLEILEKFKDKVEVTLVGNIDDNIRHIIDSYRESFTHLHRVNPVDMPKILFDHDVFVSNSLEEGLAVSICEAMSMGLAVIATRESGAEEIIDNGINGLLINSGKINELEICIEHLLADVDFRLSLGREARYKTIDLVNWSTYSKKLGEIYDVI